MIKRNALAIAATIALVFLGQSVARAERWSRQVSNSEWIPLAAPRAAQSQEIEGEGPNGLTTAADRQVLSQVQPISLPPVLQQQYQEQLLQLQKTQESIEKLLLLQQQLKDQQRLLQLEGYVPGRFANSNADKTNPPSAPEDLIPPAPSSEALPPIYAAQTFRKNPNVEMDYRESPDETIPTAEGQSQQEPQPIQRLKFNAKPNAQYQIAKLRKEPANNDRNFSPATQNNHRDPEDNEEVQLVYVPAETLSQRGQLKLQAARLRKPNQPLHYRHQQYHKETQPSPSPVRPSSPTQDAFAQAFLQHLQREHDEKSEFFREERLKEIARLNEEQKEIEKRAKLHQEAVFREQELKRQREEEKQKKELEALEEQARQRELQRLRQIREKQRVDSEKRRLAELKLKEEKRKQEEENRKAEEQKSYGSELSINEKPHALPQVREHVKPHHHSSDSKTLVNNRIRNRLRPKLQHHQHQQQKPPTNYPEQDGPPALQPNQPPLAIYMENSNSETRKAKVSDALRLLRNAKTIAVLDTVEANAPAVFVGPSSLDPPPRYVKFNLPYLSAIDNNRVERRVEKLPFFVAPLSFEPPPGYSKIPFPAPHIGSVVVNTLNLDLQSENTHQNQNQSPSLANRHSTYEDDRQSSAESYEDETTVIYAPETTTQKHYISSTLRSHSARPRNRPYHANEERTRVQTIEEKRIPSISFQEEQTTERIERPLKTRQYHSTLSPSTSYNSRVTSSLNYPSSIPETTPRYHDRNIPNNEAAKESIYDKHLITNQDTKDRNHYRIPEQQRHHYTIIPSNHQMNADYREPTKYDDASSVIGSTQYSLPAELPAISPHLPGLVNALIEKNEAITTTESTTTTTTTTTTETPTTKPRIRGRQRGRTITRPTTTTQGPSRTSSDRSRRPYNRSRTRVTTTTEAYRESSYEPTKAKYDEATARYETETRRRPHRLQKQRGQTESKLSQSKNQKITESRVIYEPVPTVDTPSPNRNHHTVPTTDVPSYPKTEYPLTDSDLVANYPRKVAPNSDSLNYPKRTYAQNHNAQPETQYESNDDVSAYGQTKLDDSPVNGFNYQAHSGSISPESQDQAYYEAEREKDVQYDTGSTNTPYEEKTKEPEFVSIYGQGQTSYEEENYGRTDAGRPAYYHTGADSQGTDPIFVPISQNDKQQDYGHTSGLSREIVSRPTTTTTTSEPVIIRQKLRTRLSGNQFQQDPVVQTKPRGSQDEYVRFSAVNQDSDRIPSRHRSDLSRNRQKVRPQVIYKSHGQNEDDEYVRIQTPQSYTSAATPSSPTASEEEEVTYGFTRTPHFRSPQTEENYHPSTYRQNQVPSSYIESDVSEEDSSPSQITRNRQEHNIPNRKLELKVPVTPATVTKFTYPPTAVEDVLYTTKSSELANARPKVRGRTRRPGARRRPTTTTEAGLEVNNELPIDENYPRIIQTIQRPLLNPRPVVYEESYEQPESLPVVSNASVIHQQQYHQQVEDNRQPQQYILHYAPISAPADVNTYEQGKPNLRHYPTHFLSSDIYGAESQWSTKLSQNSFQSSNYPNEVIEPSKADDSVKSNSTQTTNEPEIITAGPEQPVTVVVSSQYDKINDKPETMSLNEMMQLVNFGKKTNNDDSINTTKSEVNTSTERDQSLSMENATDYIDYISRKKTAKRKGQKRRVRVRIRPLEDIVTAESQLYDNSKNNLVTTQKDYSTNSYTTMSPSSSSESSSTKSSIVDEIIDSVMKTNDQQESLTTLSPSILEEANKELQTTIAAVPETTVSDNSKEKVDFVTVASIDYNKMEEQMKSANEQANDNTSELGTRNDNHPQNHRSTWSEVQYPAEKGVADFSKYYTKNYKNDTESKENTSSVMSYSEREANTQSLSDYVKVIFDSIKNAQQADSLETKEDSNKLDKQDRVLAETTSESPEITSEIMPRVTVDSTEDLSLATMEPVRTSKSNQSGKVVRTTTTTKVSHMTEICYRGKCVMSKPKPEPRTR